jgi:hypothetical protein
MLCPSFTVLHFLSEYNKTRNILTGSSKIQSGGAISFLKELNMLSLGGIVPL